MQTINLREKRISSSALKEAHKSIRHLHWYYQKEKKDGHHFDFGNALELYLYDKKEFEEKTVVFDESKRPVPDKDYKTHANRDWKAKFLSDNEGKYVLSLEDFELIKKLCQMVENHPAYDLIFNPNNRYQTEFEWICPETGLLRYSRTDIDNPIESFILDVKTYQDDSFERACVKYDYFLQAEDQIRGAQHSGDFDEEIKYYWLAIQKTPPYSVDVFELDLGAKLKVEEVYSYVIADIKANLDKSVDELVYSKSAIRPMRVPNYYK